MNFSVCPAGRIPPGWDRFVRSRPDAHVWHLSGWLRTVHRTYGHPGFGLCAEEKGQIRGVLPLVHLNSPILGNHLISTPFADGGGPLAESGEILQGLTTAAVDLARRRGAGLVELRSFSPLPALSPSRPMESAAADKARMILDLPPSAGELMAGFKSKLRSQIRRPVKSGVTARTGGRELLRDFYGVFAENMRDLHSPVHSIRMIEQILKEFPGDARLVLVYHPDATPLACGVTIRFRDTVYNPWASSLRRFSRLSPNMLLYREMLARACDTGALRFDFGRSTIDSGPYRFKAQWGARPLALHWCRLRCKAGRAAKPSGKEESPEAGPGAGREMLSQAAGLWGRLPVSLTRIIGPPIRKYIGL